MENEKYNLKIFNKVRAIFSCFSEHRNELKYTEIVELCPEIDKNAIYRILQNLLTLGFLERNEKTNAFQIGNEVLRLAWVGMSSYDFRKIMRPYLEKLNKITNETVIVNVMRNYQGICIEKLNGTYDITITASIGRVVPLLRGASGKILAAYLDSNDVEKIYEKEKSSLNCSLSEMRHILSDIREKGFSVSFAELDMDTTGVSFPVFNRRKEVIAGISVISPTFRMHGEHLNDVITEMRFYVNEINKKLEYYE